MCERLWRQWCHFTIMKCHASDSFVIIEISLLATCYSKPIRPGRIQGHSTASNSWCLAPVTYYRPHRRQPRYFGHFRRSLWRVPVRNLTSDLHHRTQRKKANKKKEYDFGMQFYFKGSMSSASEQMALGQVDSFPLLSLLRIHRLQWVLSWPLLFREVIRKPPTLPRLWKTKKSARMLATPTMLTESTTANVVEEENEKDGPGIERKKYSWIATNKLIKNHRRP